MAPNYSLSRLPRAVRCAALAVGLTLLAHVPAFAKSGEFTYVIGAVFVETAGKRTPAMRGTEVNPGDLIVTGANGMAQLSMVDQAKLSLRSNSQMRVESYPQRVDGNEGAVLSLLRGTMRTFTSLLTPKDRGNFKMKTRAATVGIRGSGNILMTDGDVTIHHTIEGSHTISAEGGNFPVLIATPNQTVLIEFGKSPVFINTPPNLLGAAIGMVGNPPTPDATDATTGGGSDTPTGTGTTTVNSVVVDSIGAQAVGSAIRSLAGTGGAGGGIIVTPAPIGPVALPLTGTAVYDVIGATRPTNAAGVAGTLDAAALNVNFTTRTVDTNIIVTISGQTWDIGAWNVPINGSTFASNTNNPARIDALMIACKPSCGMPMGSLSGNFTGPSGQGANIAYNIGSGPSGAVAFRRRGG